MELTEVFGKFQFDLLPSDWVNKIWDDSFAEALNLPIEYESYLEEIEIGDLLTCATQFLKDWISPPDESNPLNSVEQIILNDNLPIRPRDDDDENEQIPVRIDNKTWRELLENGVQHKALLCLLCFFIQKGKTDSKKEDAIILSLKATRLYLLLIAIPGSNVFHIFNSILYSHAMESLKMCSLVSLNCPTSSKSKAKKSGPKKRKTTDSNEDDSLTEGNDDNDTEESLGPLDVNRLIQIIHSLLNDLIFLLERFKLKEEQDSLVLTIQILILITRLEKNSANIIVNTPPQNSISVLAHKAYKALLLLCLKQHGDQHETIRLILRELAPYLENAVQGTLDHNSKEETVLKDHTVKFIHYLLKFVKESAQEPITFLIQRLCVKTPDRADARAKSVHIILELMDPLPNKLFSKTVIWIMRLCFTEEIKFRITGVELISKLILLNKAALQSTVSPSTVSPSTVSPSTVSPSTTPNRSGLSYVPNFSSHKFLLATIFTRCRDSSSTVTAKALTVLANVISSNSKCIREEVESMFITPYMNLASVQDCETYSKEFYPMHLLLNKKLGLINESIDPLPGPKVVLDLLAKYTYHDKVFVRKSSIQVLVNILLLNEKFISDTLLKELVTSCRDLSVAVRKLLIQCLTDLLLKYPTHHAIPSCWVKGVLPLISDQEMKSQEKVLEVLQTLIIDNVVDYKKVNTPLHEVPWRLLPLITKLRMQKQFSAACHKWTLANYITQHTFKTITTHIGTDHNSYAWYLLASLSDYIDITNPKFVLGYFYNNVHNELMVDEFCFQLVTETLHLNNHKLSKPEQEQLKADLLASLNRFIVPLPLIARYMDMCQLITERHAGSEQIARAGVIEFAGEIIENAEHKLLKRIGPVSPPVVEDEDVLTQVIFTIGCAVLICPNRLNNEAVILLKNLLEDDDKRGEKQWKGKVGYLPQSVTVVTLSKLSLQDADTAKDLVPLFAHLLRTTRHSPIKTNLMLALSDLCVRFTSMVENYIPDMCFCLRDKDVEVRQRTLQILTDLIQQDYLKLRCPLLFHLLVMINDEDESIQDAAKSFFINSVLAKDKSILTLHFIECIFHYNNYDNHPTFSKSRMSVEEKAAFSLSGPNRLEKRRNIYRFILDNMIDDYRFHIVYRLSKDILEGVANSVISLEGSGTPLLQDAFYILSCEEIRLSPLSKSISDEPEETDNTDQQKIKNCKLTQKTLCQEFVKINIIENIGPIFIKLKKFLAKIKSPLVKDLRLCLCEMMKDYKREIDVVLAADPELASEIALDLRNASDSRSDCDETGSREDEIMRKAVILAALESEELKGTAVQEVLRRSIMGLIPPRSPPPLTPGSDSNLSPAVIPLSNSPRRSLENGEPRTGTTESIVLNESLTEDTSQPEPEAVTSQSTENEQIDESVTNIKTDETETKTSTRSKPQKRVSKKKRRK